MLQQILPCANVSVKAHRRPCTHSKQAKAVANARMSAQKLSLVWGLVQGSWQGTIGTAADGSLATSPELNPELKPKQN